MTHPPNPEGDSTARVQEPSEPDAISNALTTKRAALRFLLTFVALLGLFYLVFWPTSQTEVYHRYLGLLAQVSGFGIELLGQDVDVKGRLMISSGFTFRIVPGCDGMEAFAMFGSAVLASPVALKARLLFLFIGTATLFVVNTIRIISLFLVGTYFPSALDTVHLDIWPGLLIVVVLVFWLIWARWALRQRDLESEVPG